MRRAVFVAEIQDLYFFSQVIQNDFWEEKYALSNGKVSHSMETVINKAGFAPTTCIELCNNVVYDDRVDVWLYFDALGVPLSNKLMDSYCKAIIAICDSSLQVNATFSLHIVQRGSDIHLSQNTRHLSGGICDSFACWERYLALAEEIGSRQDAEVDILAIPYAIRMPTETSVEDALAKRIFDFLQFTNERLPGYSSEEKLHIWCGSRCWEECDYCALISRINGKTEEITRITYSLLSLVKEMQRQGIPVQCVDTKEKLSGLDILFENLLSHYFPYIVETHGCKKISNCYESTFYHESETIEVGEPLCKKYMFMKNHKVSYYIAGKGETLLIINAYGVTIDAWRPLLNHLTKEYRVIISESRGMLDNESLLVSNKEFFGLFAQVEDLTAILENENIQKLHVISWCSGAKPAILLEKTQRFHILSQTIIAGEFAPYAGSKPHHSKFRESVQEIYALVKDDDRVFDFYMKIIKKNMFTTQLPYRQYLSEKKDVDIATLLFMIIPDHLRPIILSPFDSKEKMHIFLAMCVEYYQHDIEKELQEIKSPILFLSAENDQTANPAQSAWAAQKTGARHVCIPHATHLMIMDRHEDIIKQLVPHLVSNSNKEEIEWKNNV